MLCRYRARYSATQRPRSRRARYIKVEIRASIPLRHVHLGLAVDVYGMMVLLNLYRGGSCAKSPIVLPFFL
jgi:hypothetical protein